MQHAYKTDLWQHEIVIAIAFVSEADRVEIHPAWPPRLHFILVNWFLRPELRLTFGMVARTYDFPVSSLAHQKTDGLVCAVWFRPGLKRIL